MEKIKKKALFIDDDEAFLELAKRAGGHYAEREWEVLGATNANDGFRILQEQRFDLIAIDYHMPVIDGLQILALLRRKYPNVAKVVLTGDVSENARADSFDNGAELFLTKPENREGWRDVFAAFDELTKLQAQKGFRGLLREVGLQDLLQLCCLARRSVVVRVRAAGTQGSIYIKEGAIIHAQSGETTGDSAFNDLMSLSGGEFELEPYIEPPVQSISDQWEFLLMEAARKSDEVGQSTAKSGNTEILALLATGTRRAPRLGSEMDTGDLRRSRFTKTQKNGGQELRPRIDEFLVASPQGDLMVDWQCQNSQDRLAFIRSLSQKTRELANLLPLGEFDRIEVNGPRARFVTTFSETQTTFVRTSRLPVETSVPSLLR